MAGFEVTAEAFQSVQAQFVGHPSDDVARLSRFLTSVQGGEVESVGAYKKQKSRWPRPGKFYDVRAWLQLEILSRSGSSGLRDTARDDIAAFRKLAITRQEQRCLTRIEGELANR